MVISVPFVMCSTVAHGSNKTTDHSASVNQQAEFFFSLGPYSTQSNEGTAMNAFLGDNG